MAVKTEELVASIKQIMGPIFESKGFRLRKESGALVWAKPIDATYMAAIVFDKHHPAKDDKRYTFRLHVTDGDIFDLLAYRSIYLP